MMVSPFAGSVAAPEVFRNVIEILGVVVEARFASGVWTIINGAAAAEGFSNV